MDRVPRTASGPRGMFFFGSTFDFQRDPLAFTLKAARDYGEVVTYQIANIQMYQLNHPDGIQHVLQDHRQNYIKGDYWDAIRQVNGKGLLTSEGSLWLRQRRMMQPAFHRQRVSGLAGLMKACTLRMLEGWEQAARSGAPLDINDEFTRLAIEIIAEALFSTRLDDEMYALRAALKLVQEDMFFRFAVPWYPKMGVPTLRNLRARKALRVVDDVLYRLIRSHRQDGEERGDLLAMLMSARDRDTGEAMSEQQLRDEVITLFIAGYETSAQMLTWFFHLVAGAPEWDARLAEESVQTLLGHSPAVEDLPDLPLLSMAIDETLRLYPSVWMTNRTSVQEDVVCGYRIPANVVVGISPYVIHHLPQYWPDPETFNPLRFSAEEAAARPRCAFIPFGAGPRQCIGGHFSLVEAQVVLSTILPRFRLQAVAGRVVGTQPMITLHPKGGVWMQVEKRDAPGPARSTPTASRSRPR